MKHCKKKIAGEYAKEKFVLKVSDISLCLVEEGCSFWSCKLDRQYTYNITLRRVRELFLPWKSNKYYIF